MWACAVYYLKATFGPATCEAVLEIPVTITGSGRCMSFMYQISSPRIELVVQTASGGSDQFQRIDALTYTDQDSIGMYVADDRQ